MFINQSSSDLIVILIYVDEVIIYGNNVERIKYFTIHLNSNFALKKLGDLSYFLGIEGLRVNSTLNLSQHKYINDIFNKTDLSQSKPIASFVNLRKNYSKFDDVHLKDPLKFRSIAGVVHYCTIIKLDIAFIMIKMCQLLHCLT